MNFTWNIGDILHAPILYKGYLEVESKRKVCNITVFNSLAINISSAEPILQHFKEILKSVIQNLIYPIYYNHIFLIMFIFEILNYLGFILVRFKIVLYFLIIFISGLGEDLTGSPY